MSVDIDNSTSVETFQVVLPTWSGPMDLLLDLIKSAKMNIRDVVISKITSDYLKAIDLLQKRNVDLSADFLVMASVLVLIKTRELLPRDERVEVEDDLWGGKIDSQDLIQQLLLYEKFRKAAQTLAERASLDNELIVSSEKDQKKEILPNAKGEEKIAKMSLLKLMQSFADLIEERKWNEDIRHRLTRKKNISVAKSMEEITQKLQVQEHVSLRELAADEDRFVLLSYFLAILELYKSDQIIVWQREIFGDVLLKKAEQP
eukprot:XP_019926530.1 PREDICTED: uncharacterized protein LOC109619852 [Crassostrea gigas]